MGEALLEAKDLWKSYHRSGAEIPVLRGTGFRLEKGEQVAVLGKSGVGKSTLLHVLGTLDRPDRGRVLFRGEDLTGKAERDLAAFRNRKLGFVFQFHHLLPEFSALENVMIPAIIAGTSRREAARLAGDLLEAVGLSSRQTHRPAELSGGEQQRVAMARALVMRPEVILADEPTGNLDEATSEEVHGLMADLNGRFGVAFVVATHNLRLAERMGRVLRLENGVLHPVEGAS
ncbi:ABC transporter ATP-binding protein [Myxococcota bacterium]|jgi:lipoprotein-releasing system ATP-binding protein|nr:ABC transporter ATP-binding protein [Myxococcota bacterium]